MAIEVGIRNTANSQVLAKHNILSDADVAQGVADIQAVWGGSPGEASAASLKFMIKVWKEETIVRLKNRDVQDEIDDLNAAKAAADATYNARFSEPP